MGVFGTLEVRIDPWPVEYGAEVAAVGDADDAADPGGVDTDVELPGARWTALAPAGGIAASARLRFVDGVRRLEARVVVTAPGGRRALGAFGSFAVGSVDVEGGTARLAELEVDRVAAVGSGLTPPATVAITPSLTYRGTSRPEADEDAPVRAIHDEMRAAEERLARELAAAADTLVVVDGPLTFDARTRGAAVGHVKRIERVHLSGRPRALLDGLPAGQRTPLFLLHGSRRFARYAWFVRLAAPRASDAPWSGLARHEVAAAVGLDAARRLADSTTALLPRFAAVRGLHPRAPQNLLPVAALEALLRHRLGDAVRLRRDLERAIAHDARRDRAAP